MPDHPLSRNPFGSLTAKAAREIFRTLRRNPALLLETRWVRQYLARNRLNLYLDRAEDVASTPPTEKVAANTVTYNIQAVKASVEVDRPIHLIYPIVAIERVMHQVGSLKILSIGPRTEIELFALMGLGFKPENITAVDLISYSPLVEFGDMHNLPYEDEQFDVILLGWVLSYSKDMQHVANEVLRVARKGAYIAVAADWSDPKTQGGDFNFETSHIQTCDEMLELFGNDVDEIYFRHEAKPPKRYQNMLVFDVKKS
ncbi:class I SAM-dependent methyltransferase [Azospirillum sp. Marseille-Q6669]